MPEETNRGQLQPGPKRTFSRRSFLQGAVAGGALGTSGMVAWHLAATSHREPGVDKPVGGRCAPDGASDAARWAIDPDKCTACGQCQSLCKGNAVRVLQRLDRCAYLKFCWAYYGTESAAGTDPAARLCPTGALVRKHVEGDYFQYLVREELCNACGRCVKACSIACNGSLRLEVAPDKCRASRNGGGLDCPLAMGCPAQAVQVSFARRRPASGPARQGPAGDEQREPSPTRFPPPEFH